MKSKILVVYQIPKEGIIDLFNRFDVTYPENFNFSKEEILSKIPEHDAILSIFLAPIDKEIIQAGKNLKIISNYGVGYNNIDIATATQKGIYVTNTPDVVTEPTAEIAFGLMLSCSRRISELDRKLRCEPDFQWGLMKNLGTGLFGKTLGIIGLGKIGQSVARRAIASGMNIRYFSRKRVEESIEKTYKAVYTPFEELLQVSDFITIHTPLNNETRHLIGKDQFKMMKSGAFLINTSRGQVVDEIALVEYLKNGKLSGAGLDVFENEPHITPELLLLDNVVLLPHIGTSTFEARIEIGRKAASNLIEFFDGKIPSNLVNSDVIKNLK
jgi:glyoxylate reductase